MAEDKKPETVVTLVAVERGFVCGHMVEPGQSFQWNSVDAAGKARKQPKWAVTKDQAAAELARRQRPVTAFDTRPVAAQQAAKQKAGAISGVK